MERTSALVTPDVMKWARERARLDVDTAAKKIGRPPEDIHGWEDGTVVPSMAQARKASEVYKRSLAVFYLPKPPKDFDTLKDFRTLPGNADPAYSPQLALLVRRLQARQEWLHEYRLVEGHERLRFVGSASSRSSEKSLAEDIRKTLRVTLEEQVRCPSRRDALNLWVDRAEDIGISICRAGGIEPEEARGIAIADDIAPFIFVNARDAYAARLFTLIHELAHLWINQPGISNLQGIKHRAATGDPAIEAFCNRTAALTLVDPEEFANRWQARDQSVTLEEQIEGIADHFNVSEEVIARRLLDRSIIRVVGDTDTNAAIAGALLGAVHGRDAIPPQWLRSILSCRPLPKSGTSHPRPIEFWPVDALRLAEKLLVLGLQAHDTTREETRCP